MEMKVLRGCSNKRKSGVRLEEQTDWRDSAIAHTISIDTCTLPGSYAAYTFPDWSNTFLRLLFQILKREHKVQKPL